MEKKLKALHGVIYSRVSSESQMKKGDGLNSQKKSCEDYCNRNGILIQKYFQDGGVSGNFTSREGLNNMLKYIKEQNKNKININCIVVYDIDRLMRNSKGWIELREKVAEMGCTIRSLRQDIDDSDQGILVENILMNIKEFEAKNNRTRVIDRMTSRLLDGYWPFFQPYGYKYSGTKKGGKTLEFNKNAKILKEGLVKFSKGEIVGKMKLLKFYQDKGLKGIRGGELKQGVIDRILEKDTLEFYTGYLSYKEWDIEKRPGKHPALISEKILNSILDIFNPRKDINEKLPLRGFLCCDKCNKTMTGGPSKNKLGNYYYYYFCKTKGCGKYKKPSFNSDKVHKSFLEILDKVGVSDEVLELTKEVFKSTWKDKEKITKELDKGKKSQLKSIEKNINSLNERILNAKSDKLIENYENQLIMAIEEKEILEEDLKPKNKNSLKEFEKLLEKTEEIIKNPRKIWEENSLELRHLLIGVGFGTKIYYDPKLGVQTPNISLIYKLNGMLKGENSNWWKWRVSNSRPKM